MGKKEINENIMELAKKIAPEHFEIYLGSCTEAQWHNDVLHLIQTLTAENEMRASDNIKLYQEIDTLTAENEQLKRERDEARKRNEEYVESMDIMMQDNSEYEQHLFGIKMQNLCTKMGYILCKIGRIFQLVLIA